MNQKVVWTISIGAALLSATASSMFIIRSMIDKPVAEAPRAAIVDRMAPQPAPMPIQQPGVAQVVQAPLMAQPVATAPTVSPAPYVQPAQVLESVQSVQPTQTAQVAYQPQQPQVEVAQAIKPAIREALRERIKERKESRRGQQQ